MWFYLTNSPTAGIVVVTLDRLYLILDFRYSEAAREFRHRRRAVPTARSCRSNGLCDETVVALIRKLALRRLGIEGTNLSVHRATTSLRRIGARLEVSPTTHRVLPPPRR
jgi:hypothetical protein